MTLDELNRLCEKYDVQKDVRLLSDSGWECGATEMDGPYYNEEKNVIVFTQEIRDIDDYHPEYKGIYKIPGFIPLVGDDDFCSFGERKEQSND